MLFKMCVQVFSNFDSN